jgi:anti-sigma regulatory factor (Ser/Thr protein kinase)
MAPQETSVTLRLTARPTAAAQARCALIDLSGHMTESAVSDAALLTSELVTNAVRHAGGIITIVIECLGDRVAVAVRDDSMAVPVVRRPSSNDTSGRGLQLVQSLATDWGCQMSPGGEGKTVWFTVAAA